MIYAPVLMAAPTFSPPSGAVSLGTVVTITSSLVSTNVIYYTTDGTDPTISSPAVSNSKTVEVTINAPMTIKAWAAGSGSGPSDIGSATYTIIPTSRPLTPEEWVALDLNTRQLRDHYGATSLGFIKMLYDNILNRVPDDSGLN